MAVESGQPAGETCVETPDDLQVEFDFTFSCRFESLVAAAMSSKKAANKTYFFDLPEVQLLGSIPTNNTAPGPDPPVVSTLKSFRELAEFVDMIRVKFVRSFVKPSNSFWRQTAKGRFHDEMKLLTASSVLSRHDNMVKLIGSGLVNGRLAAVYELDPLDTLRNLLPRDDFGWFSRVKNFHLKLVDFGLLIGGDFGDMPPFEQVWGCVGYVDPCFADTSKFMDKSDVFSYGVLLLELVTKRAAHEKNFYLDVWPRREYETRPKKAQCGKVCRQCSPVVVVHESLRGSTWFDPKDGAAITKLALHCVSRDLDQRPTIKEVVELLGQL
ncbi:hypothetical protein RHSIM_Rhsim02G0124400 [Rhododendron simsii]|uniref:Serine-threonine/tyrosine-protein kinase catalytic domain-containing protein n=1 Tax=Rhododendron simsii TaxID=118357 RepID=A0A834H9Q6_RHOSS|nr:hypothetical protein RHSIM_Rhsim02G0124400 [Rhododendron simsii]